MLDPAADAGRRAWLPCANCGNEDALYLLDAAPRYVFVQCGACSYRWWYDTNCGHGTLSSVQF